MYQEKLESCRAKVSWFGPSACRSLFHLTANVSDRLALTRTRTPLRHRPGAANVKGLAEVWLGKVGSVAYLRDYFLTRKRKLRCMGPDSRELPRIKISDFALQGPRRAFESWLTALDATKANPINMLRNNLAPIGQIWHKRGGFN